MGMRKFVSKPLRKNKTSTREIAVGEEKKPPASSTAKSFFQKPRSVTVRTVLHCHEQLEHSNLWLDASCSSDASSDSFHSRASNGKLSRSGSLGNRRKAYVSKSRSDGGLESLPPSNGLEPKKSCAWVTSNTDPQCDAFLDQERGIPVHDGSCLSFLYFQVNWKKLPGLRSEGKDTLFGKYLQILIQLPSQNSMGKILVPGSTAISLLLEIKMRAIIENAWQISKVAGLTNDHLLICFRFQECVNAAERNEDNSVASHDKKNDELMS